MVSVSMFLEFFIIKNLLLYYAQTNSVQKATAANMSICNSRAGRKSNRQQISTQQQFGLDVNNQATNVIFSKIFFS